MPRTEPLLRLTKSGCRQPSGERHRSALLIASPSSSSTTSAVSAAALPASAPQPLHPQPAPRPTVLLQRLSRDFPRRTAQQSLVRPLAPPGAATSGSRRGCHYGHGGGDGSAEAEQAGHQGPGEAPSPRGRTRGAGGAAAEARCRAGRRGADTGRAALCGTALFGAAGPGPEYLRAAPGRAQRAPPPSNPASQGRSAASSATRLPRAAATSRSALAAPAGLSCGPAEARAALT